MAETEGARHIFFRRPGELTRAPQEGVAFITFFSPRQKIPIKLAPNHYRFPVQGSGVYRSISAVLELVRDEFSGEELNIHLGWPLSSWLDRTAMGVFVFNLLRLPRQFPMFHFTIEYVGDRQKKRES
jgi:hypothetical protein